MIDNWNEIAQQLISKAILAPSSHNTQPWKFRVTESQIDLIADTSRSLTINDPSNRELVISCGCALMNLRVAASHYHLLAEVELSPCSEQQEWLAKVLFKYDPDNVQESELKRYIERRHTHREPFSADIIEPNIFHTLVETVDSEHCYLSSIEAPGSLTLLKALVTEGNALQWGNPKWRLELANWMHTKNHKDGLQVPFLLAPIIRYIVKHFDLGNSIGKKDCSLIDSAPLILCLSSESDLTKDWLMTGQALQKLLLAGCKLGIQASFINQAIQVETTRHRLQEIIGHKGYPQIILRLGFPSKSNSPTPRRQPDVHLVM